MLGVMRQDLHRRHCIRHMVPHVVATRFTPWIVQKRQVTNGDCHVGQVPDLWIGPHLLKDPRKDLVFLGRVWRRVSRRSFSRKHRVSRIHVRPPTRKHRRSQTHRPAVSTSKASEGLLKWESTRFERTLESLKLPDDIRCTLRCAARSLRIEIPLPDGRRFSEASEFSTRSLWVPQRAAFASIPPWARTKSLRSPG